jgi:hypothetical protein
MSLIFDKIKLCLGKALFTALSVTYCRYHVMYSYILTLILTAITKAAAMEFKKPLLPHPLPIPVRGGGRGVLGWQP